MFVFVLGSAGTAEAQTLIEESVTWTNVVGATPSGSNLTKDTAAGWNAGAVSTRLIPTANGYVECAATGVSWRAFGLGNGDSSQSFTDLEFGIVLSDTGVVKVFESGVNRGDFGSYASGNRLRVAVEGGVVKYLRNGVVFYTSTLTPSSYPLLLDTSLYTAAAALSDCVVGYDPRPSLAIDDVTLTEGNAGSVSASFRVTLLAESTETVTVNYATANGTAQAPADYQSASGTLTFLPGSPLSQQVNVDVNGDLVDEANETFLVSLSGATNALIADAQGMGTIADDDGPIEEPAVWTNVVGATPSGNDLIKNAATGWNSGAVSTRLITGIEGYVECAASGPSWHAFGLANGDSNQSFTDLEFGIVLSDTGVVKVFESGVYRGDFGSYAPGNRLRVSLQGGVVKYLRNGVAFYTSALTPNFPLRLDTSLHTAGAAINDCVVGYDPRPTLTINDVTVTEGNAGNATASFTVTLSGESSATVTVNYASADGTAQAPGDYQSASGTLTFLPGSPLSQQVHVDAIGDLIDEPDETFLVTLSGPTNALIADAQATGTIANDDGPIVEPAVWTNVVGATPSGDDLTKNAATGWNSGAVSTRLITVADGYVECTAPGLAWRGLGLANGDSSQSYSDLEFGIVLTDAGVVKVYESGVYRSDFGGYASGSRFRVSVESGVVTYSKDGVVFYTSGLAPSYPLRLDTSLFTAGAALTDCVVAFTPALSIDDVTVMEGHAGSVTASFTVTLSSESSATVTVNYATADGTAQGSVDYQSASGTLTFLPGSPRTQQVNVDVTGDLIDESNETFLVSLSGATNALMGDAQATGTIVDDDGPIEESVAWANVVGAIPSGNNLTKNTAAGWGNSGAVSTRLISAGNGFVECTATGLSWRGLGLGNGDSNQSYTDIDFAILLTDTGVVKVFEGGVYRGDVGSYASGNRLRVSVENGVVKYRRNGTLLYTSSVPPSYPLQLDTSLFGAGAALSNCLVSYDPRPSLAIDDVTVTEGDAGSVTASFTVTLSAASSQTVTVDYATVEGTALPPGDYQPASGTLTFLPGSPLSQQVDVAVNGDLLDEPSETFLVSLFGATNALIADGQGTGTIVDDESPAEESAVWTNVVGATPSANHLTKNTATGWTSGAVSTRLITGLTGYAECAATGLSWRGFGLGNGDSNQSFTDIEFGIVLTDTGVVKVFESGVYRGDFGSYAAGNRLRVAVEGGVVRYLRNGVVFYTSGLTPSYPLRLDTSLYTAGSSINDCVVGYSQRPSLDVRVAASFDDAEERNDTGAVTRAGLDLEMTLDAAEQTVGLRFAGVPIPQGATILSAHVQFTADQPTSDATSLTIEGEAANNPATFSNAGFAISSRPRTSASASWSPAAWTAEGVAGLDQRTTDLTTVLQEIVNRPGWTPGNALVLVVTGTGKRVARSWDGDPARAPLLHVEYSVVP